MVRRQKLGFPVLKQRAETSLRPKLLPRLGADAAAMAILAGVLFVAARVGKRSDTSLTVPQERSASGKLEAYGPGFCTRGQKIFESESWALAPLSDGEDFTLSSNKYLTNICILSFFKNMRNH